MGGAKRGSSLGTSKTNTQINKVVEQKAATRAYTPPTLDISRIPPIGSYGYNVFRQNITPAERKELDKYVKSLQKEEEVVSLNSPFDADPFSITEEELVGEELEPTENGLVEEGDLGTAFDLQTTVTDPETGIRSFQTTIREQDYGEAPVYTDAETALENYLEFYNRVQAQQNATGSVYNYNNYDPSDFARMGFAGPRAVQQRAGTEVVQDFLTENEIPLTQERDGVTYYLTTGIGTPESYGARGDGQYIAQGPVGTYSTVFVEDPNVVEEMLSDPIIQLAASFIPGGNLALTGAQLAAGVDVNPLQAASGLMQGLELTGLVRPPSALPEGVQGPPDAGQGLFGTTYNQTQALVEAASAGNIEEAALGMLGSSLVNQGLEQAGITGETFGLTQQQLESGVDRTVNALAQGEELDEALAEGFGREIIEGVAEALPSVDAPSLGFIEDAIRPVIEPVLEVVEQVAQPFVDVVEQVGPQIEDAIRATGETLEPVVETIVETASDVGRPIEDIVRETGSTVEDVVRAGGEVFEPVVETIAELGPPVEDALRDIGSEIEDTVRDIGTELEPVVETIAELGPPVEDVVREIGSTVEDVVREAGSTTEDVVRATGETLEPVVETIAELGPPVEDVLREVGSTTEDIVRAGGEVIEPVVEVIEELGPPVEDIVRETGSTVEDVVRETGSTVEDVVRETGSTIEDVVKEGGDVLEDIVDLGDISQPRSGMLTSPILPFLLQQQQQQQPTQVEDLFAKELFQFETEIGISPEYFQYEEIPEGVELFKADGSLIPILTRPRTYSF
jgi:soluble P-type ATPase